MIDLTREELSDLVDAVSVAVEELRHMAEMDEDYSPKDCEEISAKADRLDDLFPKLTAALTVSAYADAQARGREV
jgi:hypothetical protein